MYNKTCLSKAGLRASLSVKLNWICINVLGVEELGYKNNISNGRKTDFLHLHEEPRMNDVSYNRYAQTAKKPTMQKCLKGCI